MKKHILATGARVINFFAAETPDFRPPHIVCGPGSDPASEVPPGVP